MRHLYPIITTPDLAQCRKFYVEAFGARVLFQEDWYVHLSIAGWEIGFLHPSHPTRLPVFQHTAPTRGVCIALFGCEREIFGSEYVIFGDATTAQMHPCDRRLRFQPALVGGFLDPLSGLREILRDACAARIGEAETSVAWFVFGARSCTGWLSEKCPAHRVVCGSTFG